LSTFLLDQFYLSSNVSWKSISVFQISFEPDLWPDRANVRIDEHVVRLRFRKNFSERTYWRIESFGRLEIGRNPDQNERILGGFSFLSFRFYYFWNFVFFYCKLKMLEWVHVNNFKEWRSLFWKIFAVRTSLCWILVQLHIRKKLLLLHFTV